MSKATCTDEEFIELYNTHMSAAKVARVLGIAERQVNYRRNSIEKKYDMVFKSDHVGSPRYVPPGRKETPSRLNLNISNGVVIVFSDAHFWPGIHTTAFRALIKFIENFKPVAVIANGDIFDGAQASRHPRIGWEGAPSIIQELKACEIAMGEIDDTAKSARHNTKLIWTMGNHDQRFASRLSANAPQYEFVKGFNLSDHFASWQHCTSCWVTEKLVVKHRWKGGIHATHNNTVNAGVTMVTGHLHSLKVTPWNDLTGNRYGVDTGTLADTDGPQFDAYMEHNPANWRSGFAVLTIKNDHLLWPELVLKHDENHVEFRGEIVKV